MVALIATGLANLASVQAALVRVGAEVVLTTDPTIVAEASHVVLPGVGHFGPGMAALRAHGLVESLRQRAAQGRPLLGICLGLQLLAEGSDEAPGVAGLGIVPGRARRLGPGVAVPQLSWNAVRAGPDCRLLCDGAAYFAHSYALAPTATGAATVLYGGTHLAALERGSLLGCQFHPELSGDWGHALLTRWLRDEAATRPGSLAVGPRLIPCLDVRDGRVVKGVQFAGLRDAGDPVDQARAYAAQGADELVMLDVSATPQGRGTATETVQAIRAVLPVPLTVGGGVRTVADAARLLAAGADKVAVNSAAVADPTLLTALAERFGTQCVVLALDAARTASGWEVVVHSGKTRTGIDAVRWAARACALGAGEVLLTSFDRDGTGLGYDLALLAAVRAVVEVPVVASGGGRTPAHMDEALTAGADAVLAASIFHDGHTTVGAVKQALRERGREVRL